MTSTTQQHLRTIATHWEHLDAALDSHTETWPPSGKADLLRALDTRDAERIAYDRAHTAHRRTQERSPDQIGAIAAPIDLDIHDLMTTTETALIETADQIAAACQHAPLTPAPANWRTRGWTQADRDRRNAAAAIDRANPRRWRYVGLRTAPYAALWLLTRIEGRSGPFRALTEGEHRHITNVAAEAAGRIEHALDLVEKVHVLAAPCACGGRVSLHGGEGAPPVARCAGCGSVWLTPSAA